MGVEIMANPWFRVWADMINDPKWRTISRISKQEVSRVVAVYLHMLTCASSASDRGRTEGWCDEDVATALDIETEQVETIRIAMQGRVLDGDQLAGWSKRQPIREDDSSARSKAWREKKDFDERNRTQPNATERMQTHANATERMQTHANATERMQTHANATERKKTQRREEEIREEEKRVDLKAEMQASSILPLTEPNTGVPLDQAPVKKVRGSRIAPEWTPNNEDRHFCSMERPDLLIDKTAMAFRDYWLGAPSPKGVKNDWSATWRNWVRNEKTFSSNSPANRNFDLASVQKSENEKAKKLLFGDDDMETIDA